MGPFSAEASTVSPHLYGNQHRGAIGAAVAGVVLAVALGVLTRR
jgi:hypothetical protein